AKKGNGIAEWADRFGKEFPTQQRAASSSDSGRRSVGLGDDDEGSEADDSNEDDNDSDGLADTNDDGYEHTEDNEREEDDAAMDYPEVDWRPIALNKWRKAKINGGAWLFVKKR